MKACPHCAGAVQGACPHHGRPQPPSLEAREWRRIWTAAAVAALFAAVWAAHAFVSPRPASVPEPTSVRRITERDVPQAEAFAPLYRHHMILSLRCHVGDNGLLHAYASLINRAASREVLAEIEAFDQREAERARASAEYDSVSPASPECRDLSARIDALKSAMDAFPQ